MQELVLDRSMPCLCCDRPVLVSSKDLAKCKTPAALCTGCVATVPPAVVKAMFLMRSQIATLHQEQEKMKNDIRLLFGAQQDIEQAYLTASPRTEARSR